MPEVDTVPLTAQALGSLVKSARDIMRKDKGLNGDLDRLPVLTWLMFLKFLDDMEQVRETEATLAGEIFKPTIHAPYRWRDWAADSAGITGDELLTFVSQEEAVLPDGSKGPGLFHYLRSLQSDNGQDRRDVVATVFRGISNRMSNGYLLREVINKIDEIHFNSSKEIHVLGHLYESLLKEMRDAAGDAGEFYTPRPLVQLMVRVTDPQIGEVVEDPAFGTGGFLTEAFSHLEDQCVTVDDAHVLQERSVRGGEAKSLPYLLGLMNLLLHGLRYPRLNFGNSLGVRLTDIADDQRADIILTNPPFGGEEERGILANFPRDKQTSETALLFLQLIMRKLRRPSSSGSGGGRAAVVVPNGTLFADGVAARVKEELLTDFNLHTVLRLPKGVFQPYTSIETNVLFFDRSGATKEIWYYEHPLPPERQQLKNPCYTKTNALRFSEFKLFIEWWNDREENEHAWRVKPDDVLVYDESGNVVAADLNITNPARQAEAELPDPDELLQSLVGHHESLLGILRSIKLSAGAS
jgi:type I restriction enzyme M protein